jgi:hypothetical protein
MSLPPTHTIDFVGGDALKFAFQIQDKDLDNPEAPPVPRDLTGWTAQAQVRQTATSPEVLAEFAFQPLGVDGIVRMKLTGIQTRAFITPKNVVSDVQLTDPAGDPETVLTLNINAAQDVTRE